MGWTGRMGWMGANRIASGTVLPLPPFVPFLPQGL